MPVSTATSLVVDLGQSPFPNGWIHWYGTEPTFLEANAGFPVDDPQRYGPPEDSPELCLIDGADPDTGLDAATALRRVDPDIEIIVGIDGADLHPQDRDMADAERIFLVERDCDREWLVHTIRIILSNRFHHRNRPAQRDRDASRPLVTGGDGAALINAVDIMLLVMDGQGRIIHVNDAVSRRLGYSAEDACGMDAADFHPIPFRTTAARVVLDMIEGRTDRCTLPLLAKSGEWVSSEIKVVPGHWRGKRVHFAAVKDLTELTTSRSHFQAVFENAGLAMAMIRNSDRVCTDVNSEFERKFGCGRSEMVGKRIGEMKEITNAMAIDAVIDEVVAGRSVLDRDLPMVSGGGKPVMMLVSATPISLRGDDGMLLLARDITERHEANARIAANLTALEASAEGIAITDSAGMFTYMNPSHAELFGYDHPGELVGRSWKALYQPDVVTHIEREVFPVLAANGFWRGRLPGERKNGSTVFQEVRLTLAPDNGIVCFTNDVTEIVQGLRQRESLLAQTNSLWVICDFEGRAVQFNDAWVELLGVEKENIRAGSVFDHVHAEDLDAAATEFEQLKQGEGVANFVVRMTGPDGQVRWLNWCAISSPEDGLVYATAHDITRLRLAEQSLMDNLAGIKSLTEMKANFLSMASHELRTPLAGIALGVGLVRNHRAALSEEETGNILDGIGRGVNHMSGLLDDLLVSSRLQQFHMSIKPELLDLAGFVDATVGMLDEECRPRVVRTLALDTPRAPVDRNLLQHILVNLLSNACKYSPDGGDVELHLTLEGTNLSIAVRDRGIGIPADQEKRVFEGFFRAKNVGQISGTGLGLFIVRQCVHLLGGEVRCSNREGGGAEFVVRLGVLPGAPSRETPESPTNANG